MSMVWRSMSVVGRIVLDMHSLNNEGGEGNQIQTRMVHIVDGSGRLAEVNAISGDMLKHIQAEHFWAIAQEEGLRLCQGCERFSPNRINADQDFIKSLGDNRDNVWILDQVLNHCAMDDIEGVLMTVGNRSTPRKSTVEFGWLVGLPDRTRTEHYFHVKYDAEGRGKGSGSETGANLGQNIFYRPASSGVYAFVIHVELDRVGYNDVSKTCAVDPAEREARIRVLLRSVAQTLLAPRGAQRNTQFPHIVDCSGAITLSQSSVPAPTISALYGGAEEVGEPLYRQQLREIVSALNEMKPESVVLKAFDSQAEFAKIMADLVNGRISAAA